MTAYIIPKQSQTICDILRPDRPGSRCSFTGGSEMRFEKRAFHVVVLLMSSVSLANAQEAPPPLDLDHVAGAEEAFVPPAQPAAQPAVQPSSEFCDGISPYADSGRSSYRSAPGHSIGTTTGQHLGHGKWFYREPRTWRPPAGESVGAFWMTQISNGAEARMVLYRYDFVPGKPQLTPRGLRQLLKVQGLLQEWPHPLTIQPSLEGELLDAQRRTVVMNSLMALGTSVSDEQVVVKAPSTRGLDGIDAEAVHIKLNALSGTSSTSGTSTGASNR